MDSMVILRLCDHISSPEVEACSISGSFSGLRPGTVEGKSRELKRLRGKTNPICCRAFAWTLGLGQLAIFFFEDSHMGILAIKNAILKCVGLKMANAAIRFQWV